MSSKIKELIEKNLIKKKDFLTNSLKYINVYSKE